VVLTLSAATAFALPVPVLSSPQSADSPASIGSGQGTGLILGGSSSFGAGLAAQQALVNLAFTPTSGGGSQSDNFRRKSFLTNSTPNDVPEPGSLWLLGSGLGLMWLASRRKKGNR
jgi:hypothetical protein